MIGLSSEQNHSIFEQPWWLDATAPGQWDAVEIEEEGRVVARFPFVVRRRYGLRILGQPGLSQTLGPWIEHTSEAPAQRVAREQDLYNRLIKKLPRFDVFLQNFHTNVTNWTPFYWQGFRQTTNYSYVIDDLTNLDAVFKAMSGSLRNNIRRASKTITVMESDNVDEVLKMSEKTFSRQGLALPYDKEQLERVDEETKKHGLRKAFYGVDEDERIHSAAYIVGDTRRMYLLVTGADPQLQHNWSGALVHWECVRAASGITKVFDFEGSMIKPISEFYRKFGGEQSPYFAMSSLSGRAERLDSIRRLIRGR